MRPIDASRSAAVIDERAGRPGRRRALPHPDARKAVDLARIGEALGMDLRRLRFAVLPVAAAAGLGGLGARRAPVVYQRLSKPRWAPPASAFGPVWSTLYVAIAAAGWRISATASATTRVAHLTQLALNGAWPASFFGIRNKRASLVIIALLDLTLSFEIARLHREDRRAAALLVPYLAWSGFATALNASVSEPEPNDYL